MNILSILNFAVLVVIALIIFDGLLTKKIVNFSKKSDDKNLENEKQKLIEENAELKANLNQKTEEVGKLEEKLSSETSKKDEFAGKNKQMFVETGSLKNDFKNARDKISEQEKIISEFNANKSQKEKEVSEKIKHLDKSRESLEDEKNRVREEDEDRKTKEKEERNRIWNEHENNVLVKLRELCENPKIQFKCFDNKNLPSSFNGKFQPDFMLEIFPSQYVIFDPKFSENKIKTYSNKQIPETIKKIKESGNTEEIYPTVFLVIPSDLIKEVSKTFESRDGYNFFILSPENLAPIVFALKEITKYEFAEQLNPQDRENIINVLSGYESFIRNQNAANILIAEKADEVIKSKQVLSEDILGEIEKKKIDVKPLTLKPNEMKRIIQSSEEQEKRVSKLISPKAPIERDEIEKAQKLL